MSLVRYSATVAALAGALLATAVVACGGDDEAAAAPAPAADAGAAADAASAPAGPSVIISAVRSKIYLGQTATIDGAAVAPSLASDIAWKVVRVPTSSAIDTASIQGAASAAPSFKPDVLGLYTFEVSGRKDGEVASVLVFVEAVDVPVFWREEYWISNDNLASTSTQVGGVHGSPARTVACARQWHPLEGQFSLPPSAGDVWEGSADVPSRVVYPDIVGATEATLVSALYVATSTSLCEQDPAMGPKPLHSTPLGKVEDLGIHGALGVGGARFSPDGSRIAFSYKMDSALGKSRLGTVGFDGSAKRELSPYQGSETPGGGLDANATRPIGDTSIVQPRWKDPTHAAWVTLVGDVDELYVIEDREGANAELFMRCPGWRLTTFDFTADGSVVAAAMSGDSKVSDIVLYQPNAVTRECEVKRNFTNNQFRTAIARDLALSPDKKMIAFYGTVLQVSEGTPEDNASVFTVPVDGATAAVRVPGASLGVSTGTGPRWAAGGAVITWSKHCSSLVGPDNRALVSIPVGGGVEHEIARDHIVSAKEGTSVFGFGQGAY